MGWINTASLRISSIQDNLIPVERAPSDKALDVNDKELRPFSIFHLSVYTANQGGNDVGKYRLLIYSVLHLISFVLLNMVM